MISVGKRNARKKISRKLLFWDFVGSVEAPGINGRDYDRFVYEK